MSGVVHVAGLEVQVGSKVRQRCAWCGAILADHDLDRVAVPVRQDPRPAMWETGGLVEVDGFAKWALSYDDCDGLPDNACALLDPEVTR